MRLRSSSNHENSTVHLINADTRSLPCMLCPASSMERFSNMRNLLEHFTNEHIAIHLYGCHLCNQASTSYPDFIMHSCFEGKEEFMTGDPKFSHCFALLLCADCGLQFSLNAGVVNDQAVHEYLSLMAVHSSTTMRLVCIYSVGQLKKDQDHFCVPFNNRMAKMDFLCKSDTELQNCCPKLCPRYFRSDNVGLGTFARTTKQFECLELININSRIKNVSIDDVLSPVIRTESKIRSMMVDVLQPNKIQKPGLPNSFTNSLHPDENKILTVEGCQEPKHCVKLFVFSYDTCIPRDILQGFLFEKDIYECGNCYNAFDNLASLKEHYQECQKNKNLPFDPMNPRCSRLVFNYGLHPSSRISCGKCPKTKLCSMVGLRLHYARDHSIFVNDEHTKLSNKKTVLTYGWEVVNSELKHPTIVPTEQGPRLSISNIDKLVQPKMDSSVDYRSPRQSKKRSSVKGLHVDDDPMEFEFERGAGNLKRVAFTRFEHKRRVGSVSLDEAISSARSTAERSITPANSQSESTRRRTNALEVDNDSKRDLRSSNRSQRARVSHSPTVADDHNSSNGSVDKAQSKRPKSERALKMEQRKLERERRENEDAEKEEQERARRRRRTKLLESEMPENTATVEPTPTNDAPKPRVNVIINEIQVLKAVNGVPAKPVKKVAEPTENVDIIELSDDSPNDQNEEEKAMKGVVTTQPVHPEESFLFCCFFCGQDIKNTTDFVQHMARHSEKIQRCPICLVFTRKEQQFKHVLHVIDHIIERHIRMDNNHCVCPHCKIDFGPIQDLEPLYYCFQHVLFLCEKSDYCMLCLGTSKVTRFKNNENKSEHWHEFHTVVYNRFICSKCMGGFPSKFALLDHNCHFTHRCTCNQVRPFPNKQAFIDHIRSAADSNSHSLVKPLNGPLGIYFPSSYRKQLKAMEIEALKQPRLVCPERNECVLFFNKYPHLVIPTKPLSSRTKTLHVIKDFSEGDHQYMSQADFPPILTKNRKRTAGDEKTEQVNSGQRQVKKFRRKQQANPEEQTVKKFRFEPASSDRSNVWKLVEKFGDDKTMTEVADVLEDLVLSVCDTAVNFANGMTKSTKRFANYNAPRRFPTAQDLIMLPLLPSQPPILFKEVQDGPVMDDALLVDTPPPFLYSIRERQSDVNVPSPQTMSPPMDDDEIEFIGEIKSQTPYLPVVQQPRKKILYVQRHGQQVGNVESSTPQMLAERSFSPMLMQSQGRNAQKSTVPEWLDYAE